MTKCKYCGQIIDDRTDDHFDSSLNRLFCPNCEQWQTVVQKDPIMDKGDWQTMCEDDESEHTVSDPVEQPPEKMAAEEMTVCIGGVMTTVKPNSILLHVTQRRWYHKHFTAWKLWRLRHLPVLQLAKVTAEYDLLIDPSGMLYVCTIIKEGDKNG